MNKRLFVALDLPEAAKEELTALQGGLPDARWTPPEQLHLTLCFIGETDGTLFLDIRDALAEIAAPAFDLRLKGLGFFPPRQTPRVLWAGVVDNPQLIRLQKQVATCLRHAGADLERRRFSPHITLARLGEGAQTRLQRYLGAHALFSGSPFAVDHFTLYSSILGRNGATHIPEAEYPLENRRKKNGPRPKAETAGGSGGDERN